MPLFIHLLPFATCLSWMTVIASQWPFSSYCFLPFNLQPEWSLNMLDNFQKNTSILLCPVEWNLNSLQQPINHAQSGPPSFSSAGPPLTHVHAPPCDHQLSWALGLNKLLFILGSLHLWPPLFFNHLFFTAGSFSALKLKLSPWIFFSFWNNPGSLHCYMY